VERLKSEPDGIMNSRVWSVDGIDPSVRESMKQFLKFVENSTKAQHSEHSYLQKLQK